MFNVIEIEFALKERRKSRHPPSPLEVLRKGPMVPCRVGRRIDMIEHVLPEVSCL